MMTVGAEFPAPDRCDVQIDRLSLRAGAVAATGTSVIIDVFRAFSCEPILLYLGASEILLEADIPTCLEMRNEAVLVGEQDGFPIHGFDISNSPTEALRKGRNEHKAKY
jgi:2-phosphosulfolactate phosphatase